MKKKNNILNLVNEIINDRENEEAIKEFAKTIPSIITMHRAVYEEMKKQKYTEEQSFKFASDYILGQLFIANQNRNKGID
ncbi:hypothetical protein [Clostridium beijerinckii]|uniref:Two-component sensor histidine kinase n=2 Tax=Bacillati TaxID=1783272 RepID=A0AAE5H744_CLOBE|nr:hypothetical protein [Clostridium beijerinckii]NOW85331.1 two-component sensor histidine kinase [Clostridium beijerinckii]NSB16478.1 two-component sensor histidine kinase [Clostridium beijerinckii]OOM25683.1 hypothetical protein CLOBE_34780 [Clostridium beijerinckii]